MKKLVEDYIKRAEKRIKMLYFLKNEKDYPDVVRESQEVVELLLKALLMYAGLDIPKIHEVGRYIEENLELFSENISENIEEIIQISRELRREGEIAFYGMEDWIPLEEYNEMDADRAIRWAEFIYNIVKKEIEL